MTFAQSDELTKLHHYHPEKMWQKHQKTWGLIHEDAAAAVVAAEQGVVAAAAAAADVAEESAAGAEEQAAVTSEAAGAWAGLAWSS